MARTRKRLGELEARVEHLTKRVDKLCDDMRNEAFLSRVADAVQRVLDTHQAITIRHYVDKKEVTTKLIKDELRELEQQQSELEWALKGVKEVRKKYGDRTI